MHIQKHFAETRTAELYELIRNYPLATFITSRDGNVVANHMPFILVICEGEKAILQAHIPRANPVWEAFDQHPRRSRFSRGRMHISAQHGIRARIRTPK